MNATNISKAIHHKDGTISYRCECGRREKHIQHFLAPVVSIGLDAEAYICRECDEARMLQFERDCQDK